MNIDLHYMRIITNFNQAAASSSGLIIKVPLKDINDYKL